MRRLRRTAVALGGTTAILLGISLTGCAALLHVLGPGEALSQVAGGLVASPSPTPTVEHYSDGSTSERGNIPKLVGQKAGILSEDGETRLVTFTVTRIVSDPQCRNAEPPAPSNGHYVEVDLEVITTAELGADGQGNTVTFAPGNWFYYPPDSPGLIAGGINAIGSEDHCELSVPPLPDRIGPAQTVTGSVLLDVAPGSVYLAYAPQNECGCGSAWEWPYSG
jgi:hypothetical protein